MEIVKENPRKYNAVQFDQELVNKYGLIKYPMVHEAIRPVQTFSEANKAVRKGIFGRRRKIMQDVPVYKITKSYYIDNVFKRNPASGRTEVTSGDWIVTDEYGNSKVYSSKEFKEKFEKTDNQEGF